MVKKTLLSMAIAAAVVSLAGCNVSSTDKYDNKISNDSVKQAGSSSVYPLFNPSPVDGSAAQLPIATDIIFAINSGPDGTPGKDGTANVTDTDAPVTTALNRVAGFSTIAPLYINFSEELDADSVIAGKTVVLAKVSTKDSPLEAEEIPTLAPVPADNYSAEPITLDNGKTPAVRILFNKPLDAKSKYLVVFTDGIKGVSGEQAGSAATYQILESKDYINNASDQVLSLRETIQGWQQLAAMTLGGKANSIFSYTFTTNGSQDALKAYAAPSIFLSQKLTVAEAEATTDAPFGGQITDVVARSIAVTLAGGNPSDLTDPAVQGMLLAVEQDTIDTIKATDTYKVQLYNAIATTKQAGLGNNSIAGVAYAPAPRTAVEVDRHAVDLVMSPGFAAPAVLLAATGSTDITTRFIQGAIELPDFLGGAVKTDFTGVTDPTTDTTMPMRIAGAMRSDPSWSANTTVGAALDPTGATPPKDFIEDAEGNQVEITNVTYNYPFPQPHDSTAATKAVPYLLTLPDLTSAACTSQSFTKTPVAIFVHGITSNRSGSALYAAQLASKCIATVAIDLPLHGVAPADGAQTIFSINADNVLKTESPWAAVAAGAAGATPVSISERHNNVWQDASSIRKDMDYSVIPVAKVLPDSTDAEKEAQKAKYAEGGSSGSAFINLQNFARTHDNLRQAVVDLLNLNASLGNISADLDTSKVFVVGHSLGGIVASAFVAVNNDPMVQAYVGVNPQNPAGVLPKVKGLIIANSGANITKLLENSPAFAPQIVGGLAQSGVSQGSESFEKFLYVFQSLIDGIDPANTASKITVPVKLFTMINDNHPTMPLPDNTVPVFDYFADAATNPFAGLVGPEAKPIKLPSAGVPTAKAPLAGTQGLKVVNSAFEVGETKIDLGSHSTFANGDVPASFGQMATESIQFILAN